MQITFEAETPHYRFRVETGRMEDVLNIMNCVRAREDADLEGDPDASPMGWDKDDAAAAAALEGDDYNPDEEELAQGGLIQGDTVIVPDPLPPANQAELSAHKAAAEKALAKQQAEFAQAAAITPDEIMSKVSRVAMDAYGRNKAGMKALLAEYNVTKFVELNGNVPVLLEFGAKAERL